MKRLNLWLRELSLSQQLLAIIILFVAIFALFLFTFLSPALDSFSEAEMYQYLHNIQDNTLMVIEGYEDDYSSFPADRGYPLTQGIYDEADESFTMIGDDEFPSYLQEDVIKNAGVHTSGTKDLKLNISASKSNDNTPVTMLYCMTLMKDGRYLVSVIDNAYRMQFRSSLINGVITMNVLVVAFLFVLLMLWISTLIVPLNQIKAYINKVKNNEPAELNVHRNDAIGEVADALTDMQAELERQSREKQEMIQNISHDLKTPLTVLHANADFVAEELSDGERLDENARAELAAAAHDIACGAEQLDGYVHVLIEASRGGETARKMPVRPAALYQKIAAEAEPVARAHGIELASTIDSAAASVREVPLDATSLTRAAANLVSNAVEHARSRGEITCTMVDGSLSISVADDGAGFSPAALDHGCERLFTDDASRAARDGERHYGLGLYTAAEAARAHGGSISLANRPSGGAIVTLTIPL